MRQTRCVLAPFHMQSHSIKLTARVLPRQALFDSSPAFVAPLPPWSIPYASLVLLGAAFLTSFVFTTCVWPLPFPFPSCSSERALSSRTERLAEPRCNAPHRLPKRGLPVADTATALLASLLFGFGTVATFAWVGVSV